MVVWRITIVVLLAIMPGRAETQTMPGSGQMAQDQGMPGDPKEHHPPTPVYQERTFMILLGLAVGGAGLVAYRVGRSRWRRGRAPVNLVSEAVLVVDLVDSTHLATHYGNGLAMQARNALKDRTMALAEARGVAFAENTGDGYLMTFPSVDKAVDTAVALLRELRDRPPDLSPGPVPQVRAGVSYGEILFDERGGRHGVAMNKAFRLEGLSQSSFARVEGESHASEMVEHNRIYVDEEAVLELRKEKSETITLRSVGFARLKGFSGLHRVYEVMWQEV